MLLTLAKLVIEIIHRNVTSNIFTRCESFYFRTHFFFFFFLGGGGGGGGGGGISAECMNSIEIDLSLLDDTRKFIP